jgi:chromosome segregation ATPase
MQNRDMRAELGEVDQTVQKLMEELQAVTARVSSSEAEATAARAEVAEKNDMLTYVSEEVDRLKEMFATKETAMVVERDEARAKAAAAETRAMAAEAAAAAAAAAQQAAEDAAVEQKTAASRAAREATAARSQAEAAQRECEVLTAAAAARVAEVEGEMRELLVTLEQQKHQSALKVKQLGALVQELMLPS